MRPALVLGRELDAVGPAAKVRVLLGLVLRRAARLCERLNLDPHGLMRHKELVLNFKSLKRDRQESQEEHTDKILHEEKVKSKAKARAKGKAKAKADVAGEGEGVPPSEAVPPPKKKRKPWWRRNLQR